MKKSKKVLSKRQKQGMMRNCGSMSVKTQRRYAAILMLVIPRTIKGKLGIGMLTNDGKFLLIAKAIHDALVADSGGFYTPAFANLALLVTQTTAFETAISNFLSGMLGGEGAKREAKTALKITLDAALAYINNLAFLDQPNAIEIITGAKMQVITPGSLNKQDFSVTQGNATGEIILRSLAARFDNKLVNAFYDWQYSTDNGVTWVPLDSTVVAHTTAIDMSVDKKTLFRKRSTTAKGGTTAWCNPIAITPM